MDLGQRGDATNCQNSLFLIAAVSYAQYVFLQEASEEGTGAKGICQAFTVVG